MLPQYFITDYKAALATQNWQAVSPLIAEDACVTFSDGSVHRGSDEIRLAFERNFAAIKSEEYVMSDIHWVLHEADVAVYIFAYHWKGEINGHAASGEGRGTAMIKLVNGKWKLIAEHLGPVGEIVLFQIS